MGTLLAAAVVGGAVGGSISLIKGNSFKDVVKDTFKGAAITTALSYGGNALFGGGGTGAGGAGAGGAGGAGGAAGMMASQTAGFTSAELAGWGGATAADTAAVAGGGFWGGVQQAGTFLGENKGLITAGQSLYGMTQAQAAQEQARQMQEQANMWGNSGGQALGVAQLQQLMQDPEQLAATDPAYKLRLRAAQRATAGYGQNSGAMAVAGANASTDWYNQRMAQLAGVAGANVNPVGQSQVAAQVQQQGNNLMGQSLASLAYGVGRKDWWGQQ